MSSNVFGSLIGYSVRDKNRLYGKVTEIVEIAQDNDSFIVAVLDSGKAMRISTVAKLFALQDMYLLKRDGDYIVYAYTKDAHVSKAKFGPQRKRIVSPCVTGNINNTATFGDEKINITSHISSGNPVYYNKQTMGESK
jgi:hypothetical protein